jgi:two-component system OmpR family response regulator
MGAIRLLHIDDEADIREIIEISLGLDPTFIVRGCESGTEGLAVAAEWCPDVILLDMMMPVIDGPATLMRLRANPVTADIPVIFMTARTQARELDHLRSVGAVGVIAKPFDPMTLAALVRRQLQPAEDPLKELRASFLQRVKRDIDALSLDRAALQNRIELPDTLDRIRHIAHGLSGAGGIYGFPEISDAAAAVEDATLAEIEGTGSDAMLSGALDELIRSASAGAHWQHGSEGAVTR